MSEKKKNLEKNHQKDNVQEPETAYNTKRITFFDSMEEMNEYDHQAYAKLSAEERLNTVLKMREAVWPGEKNLYPFGRHIFFKK